MAKKKTTRKNPYAFSSPKMERQFQELKKRFNLTRAEFEEYYKGIRKANIKGQRLKKQPDALRTVKYSLEVHHIKTRQEFTRYSKSVQSTLQRSYKKRTNIAQRERLYGNISILYGNSEVANTLIALLNSMSDSELLQFLRENKDLEPLAYDSDVFALIAYVETIGLSIEKFADRIARKV